MIRVIIEHQLKEAEDLERFIAIIREIRNEAMKRPGFIIGETLVSTDDPCNVLVITTWYSLENWKAWDTAEKRIDLTKAANALLAKPYTVRTYQFQVVREKRVWTTF